jgi:hypothetical protein
VSDPGLFGFIASTNAVGFGPPLEDGRYTFVRDPVIARDKQLALYAQGFPADRPLHGDGRRHPPADTVAPRQPITASSSVRR